MKNKKMCPKCNKETTFYVNACVMQRWHVGQHGDFLDEDGNAGIVHYPGDKDLWECAECGHSDIGYKFNVKA